MSENAGSSTPSIYEILAIMLDQLGAVAWSRLGLRHDMVSGKIEMNLEEAKVAIDVVSQLAKVVEPQLEGDDLRQVQSLVRDLKINYVQKIQDQS